MIKARYTRMMVCLLMVLQLSNVTMAVTVQEVVEDLQDWLDGRDDGSFSADLDCYAIVDGESEYEAFDGTLYFEDDSVDGWSLEANITIYCGALGSIEILSKVVDDGFFITRPDP